MHYVVLSNRIKKNHTELACRFHQMAWQYMEPNGREQREITWAERNHMIFLGSMKSHDKTMKPNGTYCNRITRFLSKWARNMDVPLTPVERNKTHPYIIHHFLMSCVRIRSDKTDEIDPVNPNKRALWSLQPVWQ